MTEDEFAHAVRELCQEHGGSVTSWGRTDARSRSVGGFSGDPHTHWFGADVVWDRPGLAVELSTYGLYGIHERDHTHLQPLGYPPGPLTVEQVRQWRAKTASSLPSHLWGTRERKEQSGV